jgi:hypothetical protein
MKKGLLILAAAVMILAPLSAPAPAQVFDGPYYGGFYRGYWGPGPYWGSNPYWGGWAPVWQPYAGEVKLDTKVKTAEVFINGSFAGSTKHNRSIYLRPGTYTIEIREGGRTHYAEKVYVVAGKTLKLRPSL